MKVPIEDENEKVEPADTKAGDQGDDQAKAADATDADEAARVEAAKRAGEAAAEEDFKADADRMRSQRDELQKQLDDAAAEVEAAKKEAAEASDRLVRLQADWENYRRRTAQERLDERERAAEKLVVNLLPVLDDMERASEHAAKNNADDENLMQFVDGVNAVHDKMLDVLSKDGVEVIDPVGQAFDPLVHQAVGREENKDVYDETVAQVYQKGYRMGGKVIRSAMVTVTYGGPKRPAPEPEDGESKGEAAEPSDPGKSGDAE